MGARPEPTVSRRRKGSSGPGAGEALVRGGNHPGFGNLPGRDQATMGAMMRAKLFRARLSRLFTVPRFVSVISAISS